MLRFTTAGESHGPLLVAILEGMVAGVPLSAAAIDAQLARRQQGYGRGRRMQIESDRAELVGGVRAGETTGAPIAMLIRNADAKNWIAIMDPAADRTGAEMRPRAVTRPRPGHADASGMLKYDRDDARDILERASARETAARVAVGAVCRSFLAQFGVDIGSHVVELGGIRVREIELPVDLNAAADASPVRVLDSDAGDRMVAAIDAAKRDGDTLGGVCEIVARGLPVGLGSHVSWDRRLDARIGAAMMSIPAVKALEIGLGFEASRRPGSRVHDEIAARESDARTGRLGRATNGAGGLEGGMTTGEPVVVRVGMKPISTLMRPLGSVEMPTRETAPSTIERSDVTAVPAMGVIAEAMLAIVIADAFVEKFGGDSLAETRRNFDGYIRRLDERDRAAGTSAG